jgi:hypothetical protein
MGEGKQVLSGAEVPLQEHAFRVLQVVTLALTSILLFYFVGALEFHQHLWPKNVMYSVG